ncbi:MAG: hypothetical protein JW936_11270 [Sedimentisphaerales bacterium]|nr:hypothetical protein [Sedimentisphaerales bacterium]
MDRVLLEMLVCPLTQEPLREADGQLVNDKWGLKYPVRNGIPVMIPAEAELPAGVASLRQMKSQVRSEKRAAER